MSDDLLKKAQKKVKKKKDFFSHLFIFIPCMAILFMVAFIATPASPWWVVFPFLGWGMGIIGQYFEAFGTEHLNFLGKNWEEDELEKEVMRLRRRQDLLEEIRGAHLDISEEEELKLKILEKKYLDDDLV